MNTAKQIREPRTDYLALEEPALLRGFELLATAEGGIAELRGLILALAVQGRLVSQDSSDEPARWSLARIRTAKEQLIASEKTKRRATKNHTANVGLAAGLPKGWEWASLSELVTVLNGRAYAKQELLNAGTPVLRVGNLFTSKHWYYSDLQLEDDKYCDAGDLLFAWSASFGPFIWTGPRVIYHYHIWKLALHSETEFYKNYLYTFLLKKTQEMKASGHGVSMLHITKEAVEKIAVPVPPLAEQHRIVARVEELMTLCDELEARGRLADKQHTRLTANLFDALTASDSAQTLANNWNSIATHFDLLLDRPQAIDALEQTILQLAVRGLLVPQDASDEPTSSALARAAALIQPSAKTPEEDWPFDLPPSWEWRRLASLHPEFQNGISSRGDANGIPITVIRLADITNGRVSLSDPRVLPISAAAVPKYGIDVGDILVIRVNGSADLVGKFVRSTEKLDAIYCDHFIRMRLPSEVLAPGYLELVGSSKVVRGEISKMFITTAGQKTINQGHIGALPLPIPPLAEQHRIVARVEHLRNLCDALRERLNKVRATQTHLAETLVMRSSR